MPWERERRLFMPYTARRGYCDRQPCHKDNQIKNMKCARQSMIRGVSICLKLIWNHERKKPQGRPGSICNDNIKLRFKVIVCEIYSAGLDKVQWRTRYCKRWLMPWSAEHNVVFSRRTTLRAVVCYRFVVAVQIFVSRNAYSSRLLGRGKYPNRKCAIIYFPRNPYI
jgi:hypothetical protein